MFERRNAMLFYQTHYEGFECSKNVVYSGAVANQQLANYVPWIVEKLGKKKFFIVGSNYVYPREMSKVSEKPDRAVGGEVDGGRIPRARPFGMGLGGAARSRSRAPTWCSRTWWATRSWPSTASTRTRACRTAAVPICATVISEIEIAAMGGEYAAGSYTSVPYFMSIDTRRPTSPSSSATASSSSDPEAVTYHSLEAAVLPGLPLEAGGGGRQGHRTADAIRANIGGQSYDAPGGKVRIDPESLHA